MKLKQIANCVKNFSKRNTTTILTIVGVGGIVLSSYLWVKQTPVAMERVKKAEEEKGEELTKKEKFKAGAPAYVGPGLSTVTTIGIFVAANRIGVREIANLAAAYKLSEDKLKKRVDAEKRTVGEKATDDIGKNVMEEELRRSPNPIVGDADGLYWIIDKMFGVKFRSSTPIVQDVVNDLNAALNEGDRLTPADLFDRLGIDPDMVPKIAEDYVWGRGLTGLIKLKSDPQWVTDINGNPVMILEFKNDPIHWELAETLSEPAY